MIGTPCDVPEPRNVNEKDINAIKVKRVVVWSNPVSPANCKVRRVQLRQGWGYATGRSGHAKVIGVPFPFAFAARVFAPSAVPPNLITPAPKISQTPR